MENDLIIELREWLQGRRPGWDIAQSVRKVLAVLDAAQLAQQHGVRDGWKPVPVEPTEAMLDAAINCPTPAVFMDSISGMQRLMSGYRYRAMLAAAPAPVAEPASPWVAVSERLPDRGAGQVVVRMSNGHKDLAWPNYKGEAFSGWTFRNPDEDRSPTHWLPLPPEQEVKA